MSTAEQATISWRPLPRQVRLITCKADEILFGGSRGGGKSDANLGHFFSKAHKYGQAAKGLIIRRTLKGLSDVEARSKEIFGQIFPVKDHWAEMKKQWTFPNGATLKMGYCDKDDDVFQYLGHSYSDIYPEELTQWEKEETYLWLFSINRSPSVPCQIISNTNPGGPGHKWVKKRFIDPAPPETIMTEKIVTPDGRELHRTRTFIQSRLSDNPYLLNTGYEAGLLSLPEKQRLMYYDGRWDVTEGCFLDEWNPEIHICKTFVPPPTWERWFSFDWGYDSPYHGLWWCKSPAGEWKIYRELAGVDPDDDSKGVRHKPEKVAELIREIELRAGEYISSRWADLAIFEDRLGENSIGECFAQAGVRFEKAKKANKKLSIDLFRSKLAIINGTSQLKIMDNCRVTIRTIPTIQVDKNNSDQYDTRGIDHAFDAALYGIRQNMGSEDELLELSSGYKLNAVKSAQGRYGWR